MGSQGTSLLLINLDYGYVPAAVASTILSPGSKYAYSVATAVSKHTNLIPQRVFQ